MKKQRISMLLALVIAFSLTTACGGAQHSETAEPVDSSTVSTAPQVSAVPESMAKAQSLQEELSLAEPEVQEPELIRQVELPISQEGETLSLWMRSNFMDTDPIQTMADSPILAKAQELTGVTIDFIEVSNGAESENFNLMLAGGDYTDIIYNFGKLYTGGMDSAVENDIIVDLTEYFDVTPCYESILLSDDSVRKTVTSDEGVVGAFYSVYASTPYLTTGLTIRGDWLEELGLESPRTYEDYENVLLAFKNAYDPAYPLYLPSCGTLTELTKGYAFSYSVAGDNVTLFAARNGNVIFSPVCDEFRDYLTMMHDWYEKGLISKDFATDGDWMFMHSQYQSMMANGDTGIVSLGAGLYSEFVNVGRDVDENYRLEGIVNPRLNEGDQVGETPSARASDAIFSITDANGKASLACQWCDFWYTQEGSMLSGYGIEGESYRLDDMGKPEYTDYVLNNDTYSDRSMKNYYSFNTCSLVDPEKNLSGVSDAGLAAAELWSSDPASDTFQSISMTTLSLTPDESTQYGIICADAQTYCLENVLKFINGDKSIEADWDSYVAELQAMGVAEAVEIVQSAYDRYLLR